MSSSTLRLRKLRAPPPPLCSSSAEPKPYPRNPNSFDASTNQALSEPDYEAQALKLKGSGQLNRWSRARTIRSGHKLERLVEPISPVQQHGESELKESSTVTSSDEDDGVEVTTGKGIYMVSNGTGWTADHSVVAALAQFEHCLVDRGCPVNTRLFSGIDDVERLMEIIKQAAKEGAMVVYTLADPSMAESARQACKLWGILSTDILGPITEAISTHLGVSPSGLPREASVRNSPLTDDYFRRIEAIGFTIKQDGGARPQNLYEADIVLVGVSRTGKTPLSIYLAQKGYKMANVPIVMDVELPKSLFEVDPQKVFGLTINAVVLQAIRKARARSLGFSQEVRNNYSDMDCVKEELDFAGRIFARNPVWPLIDVTGKSTEETAAVILRLYHDRKHKRSMPRISKRY